MTDYNKDISLLTEFIMVVKKFYDTGPWINLKTFAKKKEFLFWNILMAQIQNGCSKEY